MVHHTHICAYIRIMEKTDITVALYDDATCGLTPVLPYVGTSFDGKHFTRAAKHCLSSALSRSGFDVADCNPYSAAIDAQELAVLVNRRAADACIILSYAAFGSRRSFNDVSGFNVRAPSGRLFSRSRVLCEDICAKLHMRMCGSVGIDGVFGAIGCPSAVIEPGYLTCFDEAKLVYDPDFALNVAESAALGICEHFDRPYIHREPTKPETRRALKLGTTDDDVLYIQQKLYSKLYPVEMNGVFDEGTLAAVNAFCADEGFKSVCENESVYPELHDAITAIGGGRTRLI